MTITIDLDDFLDWHSEIISEQINTNEYVRQIAQYGASPITDCKSMTDLLCEVGGILPTYFILTPQSKYNLNYDSTNEEDTLVEEITEDDCKEITGLHSDEILIEWEQED